ncbi:flagellum-specific ATP synthase [Achromobacter deleyi]|uniref:FliI/YscN family ATPase n=1 Tax=Achromobacter deleyi TaxID=1353891 RepID=UPI00285479F0|nr:FliI/YscN family ATPase [Achromobacter deleyi]MDR6602110.1 flagellum-specific ATP synthase [Achromobacter deleyi]
MSQTTMRPYLDAIDAAALYARDGSVRQVAGLVVTCSGPDASLGELCRITPQSGGQDILAEVVGVKPDGVVLMPYGRLDGVSTGCRVTAAGSLTGVPVGPDLLGRVVNAFCEPLDEGAPIVAIANAPLKAAPINPLRRKPIDAPLETGVRVIDAMLPLGQGQRIGIFAGSGVGKSTLLGMLARSVKADINVIALIGERGREVRDFIERQLGADTLARSVVVVATSDEPALMRARATYAALAIAEYFRDQGKSVFLTMDSVTRYAMARREIGLAAGEPPTARGYTPSVFSDIPELCERCGRLDGGGSISAIFTVLVEGDDFNEPIADSLRATLDGHIVLSRDLAHRGHYPAIDVLRSASRLVSELTSKDERALMVQASACLALLDRNRQMVDIGAYQAGSNPVLDAALAVAPELDAWLRQDTDAPDSRDGAFAALADVLRKLQMEKA